MTTPVTPPDPTYIVCPACCVGDRFMQARRIYTIELVGGKLQRNWATGENASADIVCSNCWTLLRWDAEAQKFVPVASQPTFKPF